MVDREALPRLTLNDAIYVRVGCLRARGAKKTSRGFAQKLMKNEWNKWKNHFYEMKGDVGMSVHEKERKQEDAYTKTQTHS